MSVHECYMLVWAMLRGFSHDTSMTKSCLQRFFETKSQISKKIQADPLVALLPVCLPTQYKETSAFSKKHGHLGRYYLYPDWQQLKTEKQVNDLKYKLKNCQDRENMKIDEAMQQSRGLTTTGSEYFRVCNQGYKCDNREDDEDTTNDNELEFQEPTEKDKQDTGNEKKEQTLAE